MTSRSEQARYLIKRKHCSDEQDTIPWGNTILVRMKPNFDMRVNLVIAG